MGYLDGCGYERIVTDLPDDHHAAEPRDVKAAGQYALDILSRADRGREMGQLARVNAKSRFCANDVIPQYERYYQRVLAETRAASA